MSHCFDYQKWMDASSLIDLGFVGPKYTWTNDVYGGRGIKERLDRAIVNHSWIQIILKLK